MNDPEADALAALFDAYADQLFRYCWFRLRNTDIAQIALRDTLIVAAAHMRRLADPSALASWLYALARAECGRRRPVPAAEADEPPARPSQPDADSRLLAWNAVTSMDAADAEVLELACRHDVDLGRVLGLSAPDAGALLDRARAGLGRALGAEILVSRAIHACPDRAAVLRGWAGTMTPELRERILRHAAGCRVCGPNPVRKVSAARVFALLPVISLPPGTRRRVLEFAADQQSSAYREYAISRAAELDESGFPVPASRIPVAEPIKSGTEEGSTAPVSRGGLGGRLPPVSRGRPEVPAQAPGRQVLIAMGAAAAVAAAAATVASVIVFGNPVTGHHLVRGSAPPAGVAGTPPPRRDGAGVIGALPAAARPTTSPAALLPVPRDSATSGVTLFTSLTQPALTQPALTQPALTRPAPGSPLPDTPEGPPPPRVPGGPVSVTAPAPRPTSHGTLAVSPGIVDVGSGSQGQVVLTAEGGQQMWSAGTSSGELSISGYGGILAAGQSVTLIITVNRTGDGGGSALVYLDQGTPSAQTVRVFWSGIRPSPPPRPSPSPSPSPSSSPPPSPSPTPSASSGSSPPAPSASAPSPRPRWTPPPRLK